MPLVMLDKYSSITIPFKVGKTIFLQRLIFSVGNTINLQRLIFRRISNICSHINCNPVDFFFSDMDIFKPNTFLYLMVVREPITVLLLNSKMIGLHFITALGFRMVKARCVIWWLIIYFIIMIQLNLLFLIL